MRDKLTLFLTLAVIVSCVIADVRWLLKPRQNWIGAARVLANDTGACIIYEPEDSRRLYEFFEPMLKQRHCSPDALRIIIAIAPYLDPKKVKEPADKNFGMRRIVYDDGPRLVEYSLGAK